jgi:rhodanese-related sulfurtransferase
MTPANAIYPSTACFDPKNCRDVKLCLSFLFVWSLLSACSAPAQPVQNKEYELMLRVLLNQSTPTVSADELHRRQTKVLVLDAREPNEFAVSHVAGAKLVGYKQLDLKALSQVAKDQPIVVYCSVGYRSQKVTEKLLEQGFTNVKNCYGGLFEWVNRGYPVVNGAGATDSVHAYSPAWGRWLQRGNKVYK